MDWLCQSIYNFPAAGFYRHPSMRHMGGTRPYSLFGTRQERSLSEGGAPSDRERYIPNRPRVP